MIDEIKYKFYKYQKNIFSIYSYLSDEEYNFVIKTLNDISDDDIRKNKHLSSYSFVISIENNEINTSRFIVGTKTKPEKSSVWTTCSSHDEGVWTWLGISKEKVESPTSRNINKKRV